MKSYSEAWRRQMFNPALDHFILRTLVGREFVVAETLESSGHAAWCPVLLEKRRVSRYVRKFAYQKLARFPGYILCGFAGAVSWRALFERFSGVKAVLGIEGVPIQVPADVVQRIAETDFKAPSEEKVLHVGDLVEVMAGFWCEGLKLVIEELRPKEVKGAVTLFGRSTSVVVPREDVTAIL